jgi:hypothetical protein
MGPKYAGFIHILGEFWTFVFVNSIKEQVYGIRIGKMNSLILFLWFFITNLLPYFFSYV